MSQPASSQRMCLIGDMVMKQEYWIWSLPVMNICIGVRLVMLKRFVLQQFEDANQACLKCEVAQRCECVSPCRLVTCVAILPAVFSKHCSPPVSPNRNMQIERDSAVTNESNTSGTVNKAFQSFVWLDFFVVSTQNYLQMKKAYTSHENRPMNK